MKLSDDELYERLNRAFADCTMQFSLALANLSAQMDGAANALKRLGPAMQEALDGGVSLLTSDERIMYDALVACGTPEFDALVEVTDLRRQS